MNDSDWTWTHLATTIAIAVAVVVVLVSLVSMIQQVGDRGDRENTIRLRDKLAACRTIENTQARNICILKANNPYVEVVPVAG